MYTYFVCPLSNVIFSFVVGLYLTLIVFIEIQQNTCIVQW